MLSPEFIHHERVVSQRTPMERGSQRWKRVVAVGISSAMLFMAQVSTPVFAQESPVDPQVMSAISMADDLMGSLSTEEINPGQRILYPENYSPRECPQYRPMIEKYFRKWGVKVQEIAEAVMARESGCDPEAIHVNNDRRRSRDLGLFQINDIHELTFEHIFGGWVPEVYEPENNIHFASLLVETKIEAELPAFSDWSVCNQGAVNCDE